MTAQRDPRRHAIVAEKAAAWRDSLIDFGHRNTMLYFKSTKLGSLDLSKAEPAALTGLVKGNKTRLRQLFPDEDSHRDARTRARDLSKRIQLFEEEQGVDVGRVAFGLVNTSAEQHRGTSPVKPLRAPLLLCPISLKARTASETDYTLEITDEAEVNPVLLHALNQHYGIDFDRATLTERLEAHLDPMIEHDEQVERVHAELAAVAAAQRVDLTLENAAVLGAFNYAKLPMVEDLANATDLLVEHDLVAALAGYPPAKEVLEQEAAAANLPLVDQVPPASEFLVQDADSSQHRAIMTALNGQHLFIEGPPGTGKSQTIANIIAGAAAAGKRVLFVAEKRAAIEAVLNRLDEVGLDGLIFDLHQDKISKRRIAQQLAESLDQVAKEPPVEVDELHEKLVHSRWRLISHSHELHRRRDPWGLSAYEVRDRLLDLSTVQEISISFRGAQLHLLTSETVRALGEDLKNFVEQGGLRILRNSTPWAKAPVRTEQDARRVLFELDQLAGKTLKRGQDNMQRLLAQTGLRKPQDIVGWQDVLALLDAVERSVTAFGQDIFGVHLDQFHYATGNRAARARYPQPLPWKQRRDLVKRLRGMSRHGLTKKPALHAALGEVLRQRHRWHELGGAHTQPSAVLGLQEVMRDYADLRRQLASVALSAQRPDLESGPAEVIEQNLEALRDDREMLFRMPGLNAALGRFESLGLRGFLEQVADRDLAAEDTWQAFQRSWLASLDDEFKLGIPELAQFVAERQNRVNTEFREADVRHRETSARRVRRQVARHVRAAKDDYPEQARILKRQASLKTRHMPTRKLVEQASDVMLALRPCWAMSPLVVSRMLPAKRLFDLVVFDEASQIRPPDAITSIMRGDRLVVAGDEKQLPPSDFFDRAISADDEEDDDLDGNLSDYESILTALRPVIPASQMLSWHYRSADERLISFSNREIYRQGLVTFPGAAKMSPVSLELVDGVVSPGQNGSSPAEVERVVELVLAHFREHPGDSLGVITLGTKHQARIQRRLLEVRKEHPQLDEFFSDEVELGRRFFVKNLESVQGDERDVIILSIGVAKGANGRISRQGFGPLNYQGSDRRLNVAVTRAKRRMVVVSSFTADALEPRTDITGTELLRRYLEFAQRLGDVDQIGRPTTATLNGFERAVHDALLDRGILVQPQWGFSGYRIDFALAHREDPGRMILAVEADGHRYHSSQSARDRDRLRQSHLERLGWTFHRLWSSAWFSDPAEETDKIVAAWHRAHDVAEPEPERSPAAEPEPAVNKPSRGPKPQVPAGLRITEYSERQLIELCRWLMTDRLHLDRDERLKEAMAELGFQNRGKVIVERLNKAIEIAQHLADKEEN
ncbi:AAA domain-containing protein [Amycolatopsis sp. lyj-90]|uniref:AAA domain-containing protein n=1 Tax=Amycolatopsis sp. lyj-90 TaxID=2789285 RepID=UPI00397D5343